jgi:DNA-directed RNA polymerase beta subunit
MSGRAAKVRSLVPPSLRPPDKTVVDEYGEFIGDRVYVDRQAKLLTQALAFSQSHIRSFDHSVAHAIPRIIKENLKFTIVDTNAGENGILEVTDTVFYQKPTYLYTNGNDGQVRRPLFPADARTSGASYMAEVYVNMKFTPSTKVYDARLQKMVDVPNASTRIIEKVFIGKLPVMLGSELCYTRNGQHYLLPTELSKIGECPDDFFGYFIMSGDESVLLMQDKLRQHIFLLYGTKQGTMCKMTCIHRNRKSYEIRCYADVKVSSIDVFLVQFGKDNNKYNTMPSLSLLRLLYALKGEKKTIDQLVDRVISYSPVSSHVQLRKALLPSIITVSNVGDDYRKLLETAKKTDLPDEIAFEYIKSVIGTDVFPHVNDHRDPMGQKIQLFELMINQLAENLADLRPLDSRDDWAYKRVLNAASLIEAGVKEAVSAIRIEISKDKGKMTPESITTKISHSAEAAFTGVFESHFRSGTWSQKGAHSSKNKLVEKIDQAPPLDKMHKLKKIIVMTSENAQVFAPRMPRWDQIGWISLEDLTEGERCGLTKFLSATCQLSIDQNEDIIYGYFVDLLSENRTEDRVHPFLFNGKFIGWCNGVDTREKLVALRRAAKIPYDVSISFTGKLMYVFSDAERPVRPILIVDPASNQLHIELLDRGVKLSGYTDAQMNEIATVKNAAKSQTLWNATFNDLVRFGCIEFLDPLEAKYSMLLSRTTQNLDFERTMTADLQLELERMTIIQNDVNREGVSYFRNKIQELNNNTVLSVQQLDDARKKLENTMSIFNSGPNAVKEYLQKLNINLERQRKKRYTHCEIDPVAIMSDVGATNPFQERNPAPRVTLQCHMGRQSQAFPSSKYRERFAPVIRTPAWPQAPVVTTHTAEMLGVSKFPAGEHVRVAFCPYFGWNQDDACVMDEDAINRGMFMTFIYHDFSAEQTEMEGSRTFFERPPMRPNINPDKYRAIGDDGLPLIGAPLSTGDCVIGMVRLKDGSATKIDMSIYVPPGKEGIIDTVLTQQKPGTSNFVVTVKVRELRKPRAQDKFEARHAQKETVGKILRTVDMPFSSKGPIQMLVNPLAITNRMTAGWLLEVMAGAVATEKGLRWNASTFNQYDENELKTMMLAVGYRPEGTETLYNGITGQRMVANIFVGPSFENIQPQQIKDKYQSRTHGKLDPLTRQPLGGRGKFGGSALRLGEMEVQALLSHGASFIVNERLLLSSNLFETSCCRRCGKFALGSGNSTVVVCPVCRDDAELGKAGIPYVWKRIAFLLKGAAVDVTLKFETKK